MKLLASGKPIAVEEEAVLAMWHFACARVTREESSPLYGIDVELTPEGRRRLMDETSASVVRRLAFVREWKVVAMPTVMRPVEAHAFPLMPIASLQSADSLAEPLNRAITRESSGI